MSRVVIEIAAKFHPTGDRFLIKNYPKDNEPRRIGLSRHIRDLLTDHITGKAPRRPAVPRTPTGHAARQHRPSTARHATTPRPDRTQRRPDTPTATAPSPPTTWPRAAAHTAATPTPPTAPNDAPPAPTDPARTPRSPRRRRDRHISRTWFRQQIWEPALAEAGLPFHVRVHDLRHAHASWLLSGGADLQTVKDRMGHARLTTTEQYLHTLPHADAATITALDTIRNRHS